MPRGAFATCDLSMVLEGRRDLGGSVAFELFSCPRFKSHPLVLSLPATRRSRRAELRARFGAPADGEVLAI